MDHDSVMKESALASSSSSSSLTLKRSASDGTTEAKRGLRAQQPVSDPYWVLDRQHSDAVINFLIRIACQVGVVWVEPEHIHYTVEPLYNGQLEARNIVRLYIAGCPF